MTRFFGFFETVAGPLAVAGESLLEVIERPVCSPLPLAPPCCLGIFPHRGQLAVGLDTGCFGKSGNPINGGLLVVCSSDSGMVGLPVMKVVRLAHVEGNPIPSGPSSETDKPFGWVGDVEFDGRAYALIDVDHLLERVLRQ